MNFSDKFGSGQTIRYPASGYRDCKDGSLSYVGYEDRYWSASPYSVFAYCLYFNTNGYVYPSYYYNRANGFSVRCIQAVD